MSAPAPSQDFAQVLRLIQQGRQAAFRAVNLALIDTYWTVGHYLSDKVAQSGWGRGIVRELAAWLNTHEPNLKGFSAQNLWRMKQFYETYSADEKLSPLVREIDWSKHLILMANCKSPEAPLSAPCSPPKEILSKLEEEIQAGMRELEGMLASTPLSQRQSRSLSGAEGSGLVLSSVEAAEGSGD
jgi:hypothetical protein